MPLAQAKNDISKLTQDKTLNQAVLDMLAVHHSADQTISPKQSVQAALSQTKQINLPDTTF